MPYEAKISPKPYVHREKIGGKEWELPEVLLDVFDEVALRHNNPRLQPYLPTTGWGSEADLEAALQGTNGYDTLKKSIQDLGQMEPVYVFRAEEDGKHIVLEGATRVAILRDLARKNPALGKFSRVKAKVLPPQFGEREQVILLARIHVRGSGVRAWGRYIGAKFIYESVVGSDSKKPLMTVSEMAAQMEKSVSWVMRLRDAYEFARRFVDHVDTADAKKAAVKEFSTLEEISKAAVIGPRLRDYDNKQWDKLRDDVFEMVKAEAFTEYRDARFMKDFYEDPEKWALLKSGEKGIASRLANDVKTNASSVKAEIVSLEQQVARSLEREDHGLNEDDIDHLRRSIALIHAKLHPDVRPFRLALVGMTKALAEASLADVKALHHDDVEQFREALDYFNGLLSRYTPQVA